MNGGKLQKKISFFDYSLIQDGAGGFTTTGARILKLETFASIRQIKASRTSENLQEVINSVYEIKLRQRSGFMPKSDYIVQWDNHICNITGVEEDIEKQKQWVLTVVSNPLLKADDATIEMELPMTQNEYLAGTYREPYTVAEYDALKWPEVTE